MSAVLCDFAGRVDAEALRHGQHVWLSHHANWYRGTVFSIGRTRASVRFFLRSGKEVRRDVNVSALRPDKEGA